MLCQFPARFGIFISELENRRLSVNQALRLYDRVGVIKAAGTEWLEAHEEVASRSVQRDFAIIHKKLHHAFAADGCGLYQIAVRATQRRCHAVQRKKNGVDRNIHPIKAFFNFKKNYFFAVFYQKFDSPEDLTRRADGWLWDPALSSVAIALALDFSLKNWPRLRTASGISWSEKRGFRYD